ncbi:isoaspartyl peptidase/L-asparaginase family protein [Sphingobacterium daejeonense]|uniref:isoaspartyl peptidase/L-asparaginase family protein n=1 Tax=Sphingobacterium daejeonense TaxID=371142 RepID=UPI0010C2B0AC|nr:isoaspartyl peptidase/L-asparaginase [Sphingobacterium daejeonense]VTP89192.1 Isoaspartyl peptidase precursor [Sphingobacterium daejeonense]
MGKSAFFLIILICMMMKPIISNGQPSPKPKFVLAIHGGAGTILKKNMTDSLEKAYIEKLTESLQAGYDQIKQGKSSLDAVEAAIHVMEDSPLFNAGKGAVFTNQGKNELDAAIMDGSNLKAGAVAGVTSIKNPISAARAVMDKSEHVMMVGKGAEEFAAKNGIEIVDPKYFWTQQRWDGLQRALKRDAERAELDHDDKQAFLPPYKDEKFGTVGCVALDQHGNLAAGTSTGGMTNKKFGRVGDAPIIGAGTYANNETVAISCTGWGEFFIRSVAAYNVSAKMKYAKLDIKDASQQVIDEIGKLGGDGGMIAIDKNGEVAMPFNTEGMYRGTVTADGKITVEIYK